jgi:hypothetical protein
MTRASVIIFMSSFLHLLQNNYNVVNIQKLNIMSPCCCVYRPSESGLESSESDLKSQLETASISNMLLRDEVKRLQVSHFLYLVNIYMCIKLLNIWATAE